MDTALNTMIWISVLSVFVYTSGFAWKLWKQKNKIAAIVVFSLAAIALVLPYFTYMRF